MKCECARRPSLVAEPALVKSQIPSSLIQSSLICLRSAVDRLSSLLLLLPDDWECLPDLPSLHAFMEESFLTRRDDELAAAQRERRPGRPPSKREVELREAIEKDRRDYAENMEIPDLMNKTNVELMRQWKGDVQSLYLFRMARISGTNR